MRYKRLLVTGGAGFIGSAFIRKALQLPLCEKIVNLDCLTYAANLESLASVAQDLRYLFVEGNICDEALVLRLCQEHNIEAIVHFAAESHVDRSILGPQAFMETNVRGTLCLLEVVRKLPSIHFHHVSTDEVYGSIVTGSFNEDSPYHPSSPYSASKAASDHFVLAYGTTYGISYTLSHCTNNYGPWQHKEKLIPRFIEALKTQQQLPLYGTGKNVRDWLFVDDHIEALFLILDKGEKGRVYDIAGLCQKSNLEIAELLMQKMLGQVVPERISFVRDRPGHDFRYAIDCSRIQKELGWTPRHSFEEGLEKTVHFFCQEEVAR